MRNPWGSKKEYHISNKAMDSMRMNWASQEEKEICSDTVDEMCA